MNEVIRVFPSILSIIIFVLQGAFFVVIKFNDMRHLTKSVKKMEADIESIKKDQISCKERLSNIEGKLDILVTKRLKKSK